MNKASDIASKFGSTLKSAIKIALHPHAAKIKKAPNAANEPLIILANGPSLRQTINEYGSMLRESRTLAVNFAANAPEFTSLRPDYYVLADPHFFKASEDENVRRLWSNLSAVTWEMRIIIERSYLKLLRAAVKLPANVTVETFCGTGAEGYEWFENLAYRSGAAMPRPRNVLIPSIMTGIKIGYKTIYICGADHSWMQDLRVTEENEVVSGMNHFYKDPKSEVKRATNEYKGYKLHQILHSYYTAFLSYHKIERYASKQGVNIYNSTPGSYIDAFRRKKLPFDCIPGQH